MKRLPLDKQAMAWPSRRLALNQTARRQVDRHMTFGSANMTLERDAIKLNRRPHCERRNDGSDSTSIHTALAVCADRSPKTIGHN
jgi:hypothetical protein